MSWVILLFWPQLTIGGGFTGRVVGVSDGDTITVMHAGRGEKIRLHGIDAPEKGQPSAIGPNSLSLVSHSTRMCVSE